MRAMRLVIVAFVCSILLVAPVSAQQAQSVTVSGDITPAGQLVVGGAIVVAIITGMFTLLTKYVDNKFADEKSDRDETAAKVENLTALTQVVTTLVQSMDKQNTAANADRAKLIDIVETKELAAEGRKEGIAQINKHTEEVVEPVVKVIETAAKDIREAVVNVPTMEQFKKELASQLDPILEQLTDFGARFAILVKQGDSSPSSPSIPPPVAVITTNGNSSESSIGEKNGG